MDPPDVRPGLCRSVVPFAYNHLGMTLARVAAVVAVNVILLVLLIAAVETISSFFVGTATPNVVAIYRVNHTWTPNSKKVHDAWIKANPDFPEPYTHTYNRQGWISDHDIERAKPPQTYRIFYVGDSFTEGTVPMSQSVPSVVERELNERARGGPWRFEVINTGTLSYSPSIYYVLVRYVLMDYAPDLVVV